MNHHRRQTKSKERFRQAFSRIGYVVPWIESVSASGKSETSRQLRTPSTYAVNDKQFVVIACGGCKLGIKSGDTYIAFALL